MKNHLNNRMNFNNYSLVLMLVFLMLFSFPFQVNADILHLKNGRAIEGIIEKEDDRDVKLGINCGVVKFSKDQIESIQKSSFEDTQLIRQKWVKEKENSLARAREIMEKKEHEPKQVILDKQSGHVTVETLLNKKVKATLVLDTGASLVVLSSKIAASLGLDLPDKGVDTLELILADGRKVEAKRVILDSVNVQGSVIEKVEAVILPKQESNLFIQDGLLGMSFLKNFTFKIDQKNAKLILEKL